MSGYGQAPYGLFPYGLGGAPSLVRSWQPRFHIMIDRLAALQFDLINEAWQPADVAVVLRTAAAIETVWTDGQGFAERYRRGSSRLVIPDGARFVLRRTSGWPGAAIQIDVSATDLATDQF